ncbi:MAG: putative Fe-S cluster assembly protein SufT [Gammaproteobacteria bacterium]|nr:putative Fe-S cluster assembly protein SufT [Gammaproteobacteria bacterium]
MNAPRNPSGPLTVEQDCPAFLIPEGSPITLKAGMEVYVTQALGGSVTVNVNGNLARVSAEHVGALGLETDASPAQSTHAADDGKVDEAELWAQLSTCYDPEIPINIVELGLVYRCEIRALEGGGNRVEVDMTLTAPGCGMGPILVDDVYNKLRQVPNVDEVVVDLVFDPPWNAEMMSEAARLQTGLY